MWATWARLNRRMEVHEVHDVCLNPRRPRLYVDLSYKRVNGHTYIYT